MERACRARIRGIQGERAMSVRIATASAGITPINFCVSVSLWLVITTGLPAKAVAQEGTIEQLVATALERSPEIRAARTAIGAAGGQLTQAGLRPNPMLT